MNAFGKLALGAAAAGTALAAAAPAQAQYYPDYRPDYETRDTVNRVIGAIGSVAGAVAGVTRGYDPYYRGGYAAPYAYGQDRGFESHAVNACAYETDRRYYRHGRPEFRVQTVQWRHRDRATVFGSVTLPRQGYGWNSPAYRQLAIECEVRLDGRVVDYDTREYRYDPYRRW